MAGADVVLAGAETAAAAEELAGSLGGVGATVVVGAAAEVSPEVGGAAVVVDGSVALVAVASSLPATIPSAEALVVIIIDMKSVATTVTAAASRHPDRDRAALRTLAPRWPPMDIRAPTQRSRQHRQQPLAPLARRLARPSRVLHSNRPAHAKAPNETNHLYHIRKDKQLADGWCEGPGG